MAAGSNGAWEGGIAAIPRDLAAVQYWSLLAELDEVVHQIL
jgi:hypothetical protein